MKTTVKILALVLAMLTLMPMLLACQEDTQAPAANANQPTETTLNLVTKGLTQYVIVRDYKASEGEVNAVLSIVQAAKTFLGVDFVVSTFGSGTGSGGRADPGICLSPTLAVVSINIVLSACRLS